MDDADFDPGRLQSPDYSGGEPEYTRRSRRERHQGGLLGRQLALIVGANAVISLVISLLVVQCAAPASVSIVTEPAPPVGAGSPQPNATTITPNVDEPTAIALLDTAEAPASPTTQRPAMPVRHIVRPGDTLSTIAAQYDVKLEDLMKANGIDNPDYLMLGQELIVPVGGMPIMTPTFTPAPVPTNTPIPFDPPTPLPPDTTPLPVPAATILPSPTAVPTLTPVPAGEVRLSLEVLSPGDPVNEAVYIVNQGLYVRMTGWTLSNGRDAAYVFPEFGLGGNGAAVSIHSGAGNDSAADLYWGRPTTAWKQGDTATLVDGDGRVIASTSVGAAPTAAP